MYENYCAGVGGKAFNGDILPCATEFFNDESKVKQVNAWRSAAAATITFAGARLDLLKQLKTENASRCQSFGHTLTDWSPAMWSNAIAGETGELCNKVKKLMRGDDICIEAIEEEVADIVIYLDLFCQRVGIDLHNAIATKFNHVSDKLGVSNAVFSLS